MSQQPRHVRIGLVWRGHMVGERILCRRTAVSIGLRADATIQLSANEHPEFPAFMELLRLSGGRYHLVLPKDPQARVTLRGAPVNNLFVDIDGHRCLPVEAAAGGSLVVGDLCVMFQFVAGYSQPMAVRERTVLRLGLVHEDRLISDRLFSSGDRVSVGGAKGDDIVLDQDYEGPSLAFRRHGDGTATLLADKGVALRMAASEGLPVDADELVRRSMAELKGDQLRAHLPLGSRGRVRMGPYTVLFQILRQRVEVPVLPKRGIRQRVAGALFHEPVWTACLAIWFALAGVVSVQAWAVHQSVGRYLQDIQPVDDDELMEREHLIEVEVLTPEVEKPAPLEPTVASAELREKEPPKVAPEKAPKPQPTATRAANPDKPARNARERIADSTIAGAFASRNGGQIKLFAPSDGSAGEVLAGTFGDSKDHGDEPGPATGLKLAGPGGGGTYEKPVIVKRALKRSGKSHRSQLTRRPTGPKPPKLVMDIIHGTGSHKSAVGRVVMRKKNAVRRCYDNALRKDAGLQTKVVVRFVVGTAGTVTSVTVTGASGDFKSCIERKFRAIRGLPLLPAPTPFRQSYVFTQT